MIAYEDLVTALNSWRARNGLSTTPVDYGEPMPVSYDDAQSAPDEVYDLSDDSGLIMTEDMAQAGEIGSIETGVEIAQTADEAVDSDYDNPPATGDYGDYADYGDAGVEAQPASDVLYDDMAGTESYSEPPADTMDAAEGGDEYSADEYGYDQASDRGETLEAGADDVIEEQTAYDDYDPDMDAIPVDDDDLAGETVVASEPGEDEEAEALPDVPGPDDDEPHRE